MIGIQLLHFNKQNSLLTTSAISLLVSYYNWSAGFSYPDFSVSPDSSVSPPTSPFLHGTTLTLNLLLLLLSSCGSIYGSSNQPQPQLLIDLDNPHPDH